MVHYDKQKFKTRIMNIMKINSPEMSIFIIRKLKNPLTGNEIGKNKAIRLYVTYANKVDKYDKERSGYYSVPERLDRIADLI